MLRRAHPLLPASLALAILALAVPVATAAARTRLRLTVSPSRTTAGQRTHFRFRLVTLRRGKQQPAAGITVRFAGLRLRTDRRGRASALVSLGAPGEYRARARKRRAGSASATVLVLPAGSGHVGANAPVFAAPFEIPAPTSFPLGASNGTEPRVAAAHEGAVYAAWSPDPANGHAVLWRSLDGGFTFVPGPGELPGQTTGTPDVDVVVTRTGRVVLVEEDDPVGAALSLVTGYSDDGGATWKQSTGTQLVDQDRPFLAVGPDDPATRQPTVYLGYHNEFSAVGQQNMVVQVSRDGGASFEPPVPVTSPGQPAYLDLQCGASFGPSSLSVNPATGRVYLVFATLSSALGGCGTLLGSQNEFIVPATRIWVASSPDGSSGSWSHSLAVDDSAAGKIVALQFSPAALDRAGNLQLVYAESPRRYPDYDGAAIRLRRAPPDLSRWSEPLTVAPGGGPGNILPHAVAGDAGNLDVAYYEGVARAGRSPAWYLAVTQVLGAGTHRQRSSTLRPSSIPAYTGTASELMGACSTVPGSGVTNAAQCTRSADLFGLALRHDCGLVVTWPAIHNDAPGSRQATLVSSQVAGTTLCPR
jgi:hypothetical protein